MPVKPLIIPAEDFSEKEKGELHEFENLINELNRRNIPAEVAEEINKKIEDLNRYKAASKKYLKKMRGAKKGIFELLQKKLGLVPRNYYMNMWTPLGMSVFGIPLGVALSAITKNAAFIGIGLPIGLAIGSYHGKKLDKKAAEENKVLDLS
ncbi:MAG: hypothetical protein WBL27_02570 [Salinimicrobium sp.]